MLPLIRTQIIFSFKCLWINCLFLGVSIQGQRQDCAPLSLLNLRQASVEENPVLCQDIDTRQLRISQILALTDGEMNDSSWKVMKSPVKGDQDELSTPKHARTPTKTPSAQPKKMSVIRRDLFGPESSINEPSCSSVDKRTSLKRLSNANPTEVNIKKTKAWVSILSNTVGSSYKIKKIVRISV